MFSHQCKVSRYQSQPAVGTHYQCSTQDFINENPAPIFFDHYVNTIQIKRSHRLPVNLSNTLISFWGGYLKASYFPHLLYEFSLETNMFSTQVFPRIDLQTACLFPFYLCSWVSAHLLLLVNSNLLGQFFLSEKNGKYLYSEILIKEQGSMEC